MGIHLDSVLGALPRLLQDLCMLAVVLAFSIYIALVRAIALQLVIIIRICHNPWMRKLTEL